MIPDKDLYFLCDKIKQLRTAIFINYSTALLKFPVSIIEISATNDEGNLWFRITKPYHCIEDFDQTFPAQLHFYNKAFNYRISANGKATIAENTEQYATINFKLSSAEYYFFNKKNSSNYLKNLINSMINRILPNEEAILYRFESL